jgi:cytosolic carboxypeptidase protein 5
MEMVTISSRDGLTDQREPHFGAEEGLFPEASENPERRPFAFEPSKKVVVFTSRVHPGESPGSHVLNGFLDLLTDMRSD